MAGVLITQTRHGLWGRRHGSFAGKTEADVYADYGRLWDYVAARYPNVTPVLEATFRSSDGTEVKVRLYDKTAAAVVANSQLSATSTTHAPQRSSALTLVDGNRYVAQTSSPSSQGRIKFIGLERSG